MSALTDKSYVTPTPTPRRHHSDANPTSYERHTDGTPTLPRSHAYVTPSPNPLPRQADTRLSLTAPHQRHAEPTHMSRLCQTHYHATLTLGTLCSVHAVPNRATPTPCRSHASVCLLCQTQSHATLTPGILHMLSLTTPHQRHAESTPTSRLHRFKSLLT